MLFGSIVGKRPLFRGLLFFLFEKKYTCSKFPTLIRSFLPAIGWFITSVILLTLPGSAFPSTNWMGDIQFDKIIHIGMFSLLTFLICWGVYRNAGRGYTSVKWFVVAALGSLAYGIIMEYVQRDYIINRSFDGGDIIADGIGSVAGLVYSWYRFIKK